MEQKRTSGLSIACMILGILGLLLGCILVGVVFSVISICFAITIFFRDDEKKGMAIAGLSCSIIGIFVMILATSFWFSDTEPTTSENTNNEVHVEIEQENNKAEEIHEDTKEDNQTNVFGGSQEEIEEQEVVEQEVVEDDCYKNGMYFETSDFKITLDNIVLDFTEYEDEYGWHELEQGKKYIKVSFTYENIGNSDAYVSIYDYECYADGVLCDQYYGFNDDFMNANISGGRKVSFDTVYIVPSNCSEIELEYTELSLFDSDKIVIKLQ